MTDDEIEKLEQQRQLARFRLVQRDPRENSAGHMIAVMTCSGREKFFHQTMDSLKRAGSDRWVGPLMVVGDGHVEHTDGWWLFHPSSRLDRRVGQARTFFHVLKKAWSFPGFIKLTLFEDDVIVAKNSLDYISSLYYPEDVAMFSWFHRWAPNPPQPAPSWMIGPASEFSHQQAITLPASTVRALLASPQLKAWSEPHGADMLIGQVMPDAKIAYHFPNIVDHVAGETSLTGNTGARRSCTFVGEDFDARDLTRTP